MRRAIPGLLLATALLGLAACAEPRLSEDLFIVLPEDDHALACLLKSPLVSHPAGRAFGDEDLFALAHGRGRQSLWRRLEASDALQPICARLRGWMALGLQESPFGFYARVLGEEMPSVRHQSLQSVSSGLGGPERRFSEGEKAIIPRS